MLKNTNIGVKREKLGGTGVGTAMSFPITIPEGHSSFKMVTQLELEPGASVGYHKHVDDEEVYYIVSGKGLYCEDGVEAEVGAGDIMLCLEGHSHGIKNIGDCALIYGAIIAINKR